MEKAVAAKSSMAKGKVVMLVILYIVSVLIMLLGLVYAWRKGVLRWV